MADQKKKIPDVARTVTAATADRANEYIPTGNRVLGQGGKMSLTEIENLSDSLNAILALTTAISATDTTITHPTLDELASPGDLVLVEPYTSDAELRRVTAVGSGTVTVESQFDAGHAIGARVVVLRPGDTITPQEVGAVGAGDDTVAFQRALDSGHPVVVPPGTYVISQLEIPSNATLRGVGHFGSGNSSILKHKALEPGAMIVKDSAVNRITGVELSNLQLRGNDDPNETYGIDITGIGYSRFDNLWVGLVDEALKRGFTKANLYSAGEIPDTVALNNTFVHCRFNQSASGPGLLFEAAGTNGNTAMLFLQCEFSGNGTNGIRIIEGSGIEFKGCTVQSNEGGREIFLDRVKRITFTGWVEQTVGGSVHSGGGIELTDNSRWCDIKCRSSHGLASTFLDDGDQNTVSVMGETTGEQLYDDPFFVHWMGDRPHNIPNNLEQNLTWESFHDARGHGLELTISNFANVWMGIKLNRWYAGSGETGTHTGADNAGTLTDGTKVDPGPAWTADRFIGWKIKNLTDGSEATVTDNDGSTITATLAGGTDNDWDQGDKYILISPLDDDISDRWVTVAIDMDTSLFPDSPEGPFGTAEMRIYSQLKGDVMGSGGGQLHIFNRPENFRGRKNADVKFGAGSTTPIVATHDAASSDTVLTDSLASFPITGTGLEGWKVLNLTDGSEGVVVSNDGTSVTVDDLLGGTDDDFDNGDVCLICPPAEIRFSPSWFATNGTNKLRIRSIHVVDGQVQYTDSPQGPFGLEPLETTEAILGNAAFGVNIHRKQKGRLVYNTDDDRLYYATGSASEKGSHTGADDDATLEDNTQSWPTGLLVGLTLKNLTDGSEGTVTANDATTVTATLAGGTDNDWDTGDNYVVAHPWRTTYEDGSTNDITPQ